MRLKQSNICRSFLMACLMVALLCLFPGCGKTTSSNVLNSLTILSVSKGDVQVLKAGATNWVNGEVGMTLELGYVIKTNVGSGAITFFEGSTLEFSDNSQFKLTALSIKGSTSTNITVEQELGQTISRVQKLVDQASRYEVETQAGVAAVRGTVMLVRVSPDGVMSVGNIEGSIVVTAQGVVVLLPVNTHSIVIPGQAPGQPQPGSLITPTALPAITSPAPSTTMGLIPSTTSSPLPVTATNPTPDSRIAGIAVNGSVDRQSIYVGDQLNFTYSVNNTGNVPLSGVSITAGKGGIADSHDGDTNTNNLLDVGEIWVYTTGYSTLPGDVGQMINIITAAGTGSNNQRVTAETRVSVGVNSLVVKITNLGQGDLVTRDITVNGTVNDPSITQATLALNGNSQVVNVVNGTFSAVVTLADGNNRIDVTITKGEGIKATDSIELIQKQTATN